MTRSAYRTLASLLIGVMATLAGLLLTDLLRARICSGSGGSWAAAARVCVMPSGGEPPWLATPLGYLVALPAAALVGLFLWRLFSFFASGRAVRRTPAG